MFSLLIFFVNAVAPDWNLKIIAITTLSTCRHNAVAPDWNLKMVTTAFEVINGENAVAPDWNLKLGWP